MIRSRERRGLLGSIGDFVVEVGREEENQREILDFYRESFDFKFYLSIFLIYFL